MLCRHLRPYSQQERASDVFSPPHSLPLTNNKGVLETYSTSGLHKWQGTFYMSNVTDTVGHATLHVACWPLITQSRFTWSGLAEMMASPFCQIFNLCNINDNDLSYPCEILRSPGMASRIYPIHVRC